MEGNKKPTNRQAPGAQDTPKGGGNRSSPDPSSVKESHGGAGMEGLMLGEETWGKTHLERQRARVLMLVCPILSSTLS